MGVDPVTFLPVQVLAHGSLGFFAGYGYGRLQLELVK